MNTKQILFNIPKWTIYSIISIVFFIPLLGLEIISFIINIFIWIIVNQQKEEYIKFWENAEWVFNMRTWKFTEMPWSKYI